MSELEMTPATEASILASPGTHRLVREILALAETRDLLDAACDTETAAAILRARFARSTS